MPISTRNVRNKQAGFSLVEILVGLLIGLIGIIVMMQVFSVSEERKRSTTAGSDAQNTAFIALDGLQRAIMQSGNGFNQLLGCVVVLRDGNSVPLIPVFINPPHNIIPAGDDLSDTLLVAYGTSDYQPEGYPWTGGSLPTTDNFQNGDILIAAPASCDQYEPTMDKTKAPTQLVVRKENGSAFPVGTLPAGGTNALFNLGSQPKFLAYAVRSGKLTVCNFFGKDATLNPCSDKDKTNDEEIWQPVAANVIALRAVYGWRDKDPKFEIGRTRPINTTEWSSVAAIRVAVLSRSTQYERPVPNANNPALLTHVTLTPPEWTPNPGSAAVPFWSAGDRNAPEDWQDYRYRVFETQIPLRNIVWMKDGAK